MCSSSKALKMEAGFTSREMAYHAPVGPAAMLESPAETTTPPPQPASRVNAGKPILRSCSRDLFRNSANLQQSIHFIQITLSVLECWEIVLRLLVQFEELLMVKQFCSIKNSELWFSSFFVNPWSLLVVWEEDGCNLICE